MPDNRTLITIHATGLYAMSMPDDLRKALESQVVSCMKAYGITEAGAGVSVTPETEGTDAR